MEPKSLEIGGDSLRQITFLETLQAPTVSFGRCAITGEFAPCVTVYFPPFAVDAPDAERGVEYDPITKQVNFTVWNPVEIERVVSISKPGLQLLMNLLEDTESPIPPIIPHTPYKWEVMYADGSLDSELTVGENFETITNHWGIVRAEALYEIRIVPREANPNLPIYTYNIESGEFRRNGEVIDVGYENKRPPNAKAVYYRKNHISMGSVLRPDTLTRSFENTTATALQCIGWIEDGDFDDKSKMACVIGIDMYGHVRPLRYN